MKTTKALFGILTITTVLAGYVQAQSAFTNGSFEIINHAAIAPGGYANLNPGDTWLTGWTVGGPGGGDIAVNNGTEGGLNPCDGQQWMNFNGNNTAPGGILSQTFTTTVGYLYTVDFAVGGIGSGNVSLTATAVALNGSVLASNYCVPTFGVWTLFQLAFIAVSTNTTLVFTDTSVQTVAVDIALDDVSVTENLPSNFLINGSFESPVVSSQSGETSIPGWTVSGDFGLAHGPLGASAK